MLKGIKIQVPRQFETILDLGLRGVYRVFSGPLLHASDH